METVKRSELLRVGHGALIKIMPAEADNLQLTIEQAIGAGILATLLRIADDIAALRGMYNTATMLEGYHVDR